MIGKRTLAKKKSSKIKNTIFILGGLFCVVASLVLSSSSWNTRTTARIRQQELVPSSSSPPSSALNMLLQSALKTRSGDGWKIVDFSGDVDNHDDDENPHGFQCEWTLFRSTSGNEANMCVHPFHDIVSNKVRQSHRWHDCDVLPKYWHENSASNSQIYVEIGGNIGTCVMEMLLSTDAPIIAFEPNPRNVFVLKETLRKMEKSYQERIVIVPVALGDEKGSNKIYAASNNMGNSVVGKVIKDFQTQEFSENNQFDIRIEKLEDILKPGTDIGLVKMDAQGYECRIVKGFGNKIAAKMRHIHFEIAPKWQKQQGCFDLCQRLRDYGFQIWRGGKIVDGEPGGAIFDVDAIKPKSEY